MDTVTRRAVAAAAVATIAAAFMIMTAWIVKIEALIQVRPHTMPTQFNTALSFALCGSALLLAGRQRPLFANLSRLLAGTAATIGAVTIAEYGFAANLGLDEFFTPGYITTNTSSPGRMALQTAFSCVGAGSAVIALTFRRWRMAATVGSVMVTVGILSAFGYAVGLETAYGWEGLARMGLYTAILVALLGSAIVAQSWIDDQTGDPQTAPAWTPILIGLLTLSAAFMLWHVVVGWLKLSSASDATVGSRSTFVVSVVVGLLTATVVQIALAAARRKTEAEAAQFQLQKTLLDLTRAMGDVNTLQGLLPICGWCKKARTDTGYWQQVEQYLASRPHLGVNRGLCPGCAERVDEIADSNS